MVASLLRPWLNCRGSLDPAASQGRAPHLWEFSSCWSHSCCDHEVEDSHRIPEREPVAKSAIELWDLASNLCFGFRGSSELLRR